MSTSPIASAALAAVFSLAGTLVPLWAGKGAKPCTIPVGVWLAPLALAAVLGVLGGITLRANDVLSFRDPNLRTRYARLGFTPVQVIRIMDRLAGSIKVDDVNPAETKTYQYLNSTTGAPTGETDTSTTIYRFDGNSFFTIESDTYSSPTYSSSSTDTGGGRANLRIKKDGSVTIVIPSSYSNSSASTSGSDQRSGTMTETFKARPGKHATYSLLSSSTYNENDADPYNSSYNSTELLTGKAK